MAALEVVEPDAATRDMMLDELLAEFGISHLRRTPLWRCLAASGGGSRSPGRWPPSRLTFCWTNRWPASIPSRSVKSAIW